MDHFTYDATQYNTKNGSTNRPVVRSTKAKATMKYVAGVRKHLRGSLRIVNSNNPLLMIFIGDRMIREMPVPKLV